MLPKDTFTQSQYEVLKGQYPTDKSQVAIIVDKSNQIMDRTLIALGLLETGEEKTEYSFDEILGRTYKVVPNDLEYVKSGSAYSAVSPLDIDYSAAQTITISGILRINEQSKGGMLSTGIAYTKELYAYIQDLNMNSEIVAYMKANPGINPFSGQAYQPSALYTADEQYQTTLRSLGGNDLPNEIDIYPASLDAKDKIKKALDAYNTGKSESEVITYSDLSTLIDDTLRSVISVITYVLIAFTAISLVVSSIMIAINTSVSVIERTKEIGILRSIGARKRDVTNVFNAETFIIGTIAGLFGIVVTYLVEIPINIICYNTLAVPQIANLSIGSAAILVVISIAITLLSGLLPARKAAKQDPVVALRTE
jgi:putative ABC transport system permease protein